VTGQSRVSEQSKSADLQLARSFFFLLRILIYYQPDQKDGSHMAVFYFFHSKMPNLPPHSCLPAPTCQRRLPPRGAQRLPLQIYTVKAISLSLHRAFFFAELGGRVLQTTPAPHLSTNPAPVGYTSMSSSLHARVNAMAFSEIATRTLVQMQGAH
jgi:hypothetical protein